ncbi:MAG: hypothetical protein ABI037_12410 [Gemmatimonadales bacterium]
MTTSVVPTIPSRRISDTRGKIVHNLVMSYDSGDPLPEFRVQCEVVLPFEEAHAVMMDLANTKRGSVEERVKSLEHARDIVLPRIHKLATPAFRETVSKAFEDNAEEIQKAVPYTRP